MNIFLCIKLFICSSVGIANLLLVISILMLHAALHLKRYFLLIWMYDTLNCHTIFRWKVLSRYKIQGPSFYENIRWMKS